MDHGGDRAERELVEPVALCTSDGRLNPDAVGWSRRPLHDCALPGSWGRRKRWDFWGVTGPGFALNLVYADADYVGIADVWFCDLTSGESVAKSVPVPLARGMGLPDRVGGAAMRFDRGGLQLSLEEEAGGTRLRVAFAGKAETGKAGTGKAGTGKAGTGKAGTGKAETGKAGTGEVGPGETGTGKAGVGEAGPGDGGGAGDFTADVLVRRPAGHESLSVVIPWSEKRFQFTTKDVGRPAEGTVRWDGRTYELAGDGTSWGCLDFGRGKWPYRTTWNWGAGAGVVDGPDGPTTVGLQLGGKWTDGTGMTENALCVDGRLSKLSEELVWTYDTGDWLRPWTIRAPGSQRVDLTFTPVYDKRTRLQAGVAAQAVDQCFGTYAGIVVPDDGRDLAVDGVFGWAEEATWRW